jgi:methylated-DNA-protein-cysteine methyltransferase-like protein
MDRRSPSPAHARIWIVAGRIPRGRVATYGQVADLAGMPGHARLVGYALNALPDGSRVPWHRVINAQGAVSGRAEPGADRLQRSLLEGEGVKFDERGRTSLPRFRWRPQRVPPFDREPARAPAKSASRRTRKEKA